MQKEQAELLCQDEEGRQESLFSGLIDGVELKSVGNYTVLELKAVSFLSVFRIAGFTHPYLIVRLDALESMLRRGVCGIRLKEFVTV